MESKRIKLASDKEMHYIKQGEGKLLFVLIHGGDRTFQNASYWEPLIPKLALHGKVVAVDLLGHGESIPGPKSSGRGSMQDQLDGLKQIITNEGNFQDKENSHVIVIGRSFGGGVAISLADRYPEYVHGLVLIAPAVSSSYLNRISEQVRRLPTLIFWAEDDPIIPYSNHAFIVKFFENHTFVSAGSVLEEEMEKWRGHTPEMVRQKEFIEAVTQYIKQHFKG